MIPFFAILGIGHIVGWAFGNLSSSLLTPLADAIGSGVTTLAKDIGNAAVNNTVITTGTRYTQLFDTGLGLAGYIGAFALLVASAIAAVTQNYQRALAALVRVFFAIIGSFVLFMMLPEIQSAISVMSKAVAATFGNSSTQVGSSLEAMLSVSALTGTPLLMILFGVFVLLACFILWIILVIAQSIVYFTVFAMPLAFAASYKWGKKIAELTLAMLLVPFVITSILAVGLAVFGDGANFGTTLEHVVAGTGLIAIGCLTPFMLIKLIHAGEAGIQQMKNPHEIAHNTISRVSSIKNSMSSFASGGKGAGSPTAGTTGAEQTGASSTGATGGTAGASTAGVGAAVVAGAAAAKGAAQSASKTAQATAGNGSERASEPNGSVAGNRSTPSATTTNMNSTATDGAEKGTPLTATENTSFAEDGQGVTPQGANNPSGAVSSGKNDPSVETTTIPTDLASSADIPTDSAVSSTQNAQPVKSPSGGSSLSPSAPPDGSLRPAQPNEQTPLQMNQTETLTTTQQASQPLGQITPTKIESTDGGATWHEQNNPSQNIDSPVVTKSSPPLPPPTPTKIERTTTDVNSN